MASETISSGLRSRFLGGKKDNRVLSIRAHRFTPYLVRRILENENTETRRNEIDPVKTKSAPQIRLMFKTFNGYHVSRR